MIFPAILSIVPTLTTAATSVMTALGSIGTAVASFAANIAPALARVLEVVKPMLPVLSDFANALLRGMDVLKAGETIEDLGARALQAGMQGMPLNKYDNVGEYLQTLRELQLDPRMQERSPVERVLAGLSVATLGLEEKYQTRPGSFDGIWLLPLLKPDYFTPERMQSLLETRTFGREVLDYLNGSMFGGDKQEFEEKFITKNMSDLDFGELCDVLDESRKNWGELEKKVNLQEKT